MGGVPGPGQRFRGGQPGPSAQAGGAGKLMQGPARHSELAEMTAANATAQPDPQEKATPAAYQTPTAPITKRQRTTVAEQGSRKAARRKAASDKKALESIRAENKAFDDNERRGLL